MQTTQTNMSLNPSNVTAMINQSMLVELNIGFWQARKTDRAVSEEVAQNKNAKSRAGNYSKNLLPGVKEHDDLKKAVGAFRNWHYTQTIPWLDSGIRLLPMKNYLNYVTIANEKLTELHDLKRHFVTVYPTLKSAVAFELGDMFNADEYPTQSEVDRKFYFNVNYYPLPSSGDFRVDVSNEMQAELTAQYETHFQAKMQEAMQDVWDRLHTTLKHLSERLAVDDGGEKKVFRDSLVTNTQEMCALLSSLNIANDPRLEEARRELEQAMLGITAKDLRESVLVRTDVHARVNDIINKFSF
jgi:hypothetical protein